MPVPVPTPGDDSLVGSPASDTIDGLAGDDTILGLGGDDSLIGGEGDDMLDGGAGDDTLAGGAGADAYYVNRPGDTVREDAAGGPDTVYAAVGWTLGANLENLIGVGDGLRLQGNGLDNLMVGTGGDDTLGGAAGGDTLRGGDGDDLYTVNAGDLVEENADEGWDTVRTKMRAYTLTDGVEALEGTRTLPQNLTGNGLDNQITAQWEATLDGGAGDDTLTGSGHENIYIVDSVGDVVRDPVNWDADWIRTTLSVFTTFANVEATLFVGAGDFIGTGTSAGQRIVGGGGADTVYGLGGDDTLVGGGGDDSLMGGRGNDRLEGEAGDDVLDGGGDGRVNLYGGDGADTLIAAMRGGGLSGGAGADTFIFTADPDARHRKSDRLNDLNAEDIVDLSRVDADTTTDGDQAFHLVEAFTGAAGEMTARYRRLGESTLLEFDTDGDGDRDLSLNVHGRVDFSNFVL